MGHVRGQAELFDTYAKELVGQRPEVILAVTSPAVEAILKFDKTVPIVFVSVVAPERRGFIENLEHPGGNLTGFTNFESSMGGKWLEKLREIAPRVDRVGFILKPAGFFDRNPALDIPPAPHRCE